jgi:hypothetical protein
MACYEWRKVMNPVGLLSWLYGKFFTNYTVVSYVLVAAVGAVLASLLWAYAIDKYRVQHPKGAQAESVQIPAGSENANMEKESVPLEVVPAIKHTANSVPPAKHGLSVGKDSTVVGRVPDDSKIGDRSVIVGATDANGNTILNRGGTAIGTGAKADTTSIAIGEGANAGSGEKITPPPKR